MSEKSPIEWTDHTLNLWHGCSKVSAGCANCYAEQRDKRHLMSLDKHWGPSAPRLFMRSNYWKAPARWNRKARASGKRRRVFCMSMGDLFEWHAIHDIAVRQHEARDRLWRLIDSTPSLYWLLLTKRPANVRAMLPGHWFEEFPCNVSIGASIENQAAATDRLPALAELADMLIPTFLSCEPLLGAVDIAAAAPPWYFPEWVITGAESGPGARPGELDWVRSLRDQCQARGASFFFKQWHAPTKRGRVVSLPELDGRVWDEVPPYMTGQLE